MTASRSHWPVSILTSLSSLLNLLAPLILVRILTQEEVGTYKIFFLYLMVLPSFALMGGIINGFAYWSGKKTERIAAVQMSSNIVFLAAALFGLLTYFLLPFFGKNLEWNDSIILLFSVGVFCFLCSNMLEESIIANGKIWNGAILVSLSEAIRTSITVFAAYYGRTIEAVLTAYILASLARVLAGTLIAYRSNLLGLHWDNQIFKSVARYAFPVSLSVIFGSFVHHTDRLILTGIISEAEFAIYSLGCLAIPPLYILEHSVARVLIPQLSSCFDTKLEDKGKNLYRNAIEQISLVMIPATFGLVIFAEPIVRILFTDSYLGAAPYLKVFAFSYLILSLPFDAIARAKGNGKWILQNLVTFSLISVPIVILMTQFMGAIGALIGAVAVKAMMRLNSLRYTKFVTGWTIFSFLPTRSLLKTLLVAAALTIPVLLVESSFTDSRIWFLAAGSFFTVAFYPLRLALEIAINRLTDHKVNVLQLSQSLWTGGLEKMIFSLCVGLKSQSEIRPSCFTLDHKKRGISQSLIPDFEENQIKVIRNEKSSGFSFKTLIKLLGFILEERITVIHSHDLGPLIYSSIAKWITLGQLKIIHTQHSFYDFDSTNRNWTYFKFFSHFATKICVVSEHQQKQLLGRGIPVHRLVVIPNGISFTEGTSVDRTIWDETQDLSESIKKKKWLLILARVHPVKRQVEAIDIWSSLPDSIRTDWELLLVGPPAHRDYTNELTDRLKTSDHVTWIKGTSNPQLWCALSDAYLSNSKYEGHPLGPIEALSQGTPCLLSDIPGHRLFKKLHPDCVETYGHPNEWIQFLSLTPQVPANVSRSIQKKYSREEMVKSYANLFLAFHSRKRKLSSTASKDTSSTEAGKIKRA